jgi:hypothetical protein
MALGWASFTFRTTLPAARLCRDAPRDGMAEEHHKPLDSL